MTFKPKTFVPSFEDGYFNNGKGRPFRKFKDLYVIDKSVAYADLTQAAPDIWIKDFTLTPEFCKSVIQRYDNFEGKVPGRVGHGEYRPGVKDSLDMHISSQPEWHDVDKVLFSVLKESADEITDDLSAINSEMTDYFTNDTGYNMQKTVPGGKYIWHQEIGPGNVVNYNRSLTFMWYMNEDFEGGDTGFVRQGVQVEAKTGRLVLFAPFWTHIHSGFPVTDGEKYIITGWFHQGEIT